AGAQAAPVLRGARRSSDPAAGAAGKSLGHAGPPQYAGPGPVYPPLAEAVRGRPGPAAPLLNDPRRRLPFRGRSVRGAGGRGECRNSRMTMDGRTNVASAASFVRRDTCPVVSRAVVYFCRSGRAQV